MENLWTTRQVVAATGVTSRTLRHYHAFGLLIPANTTNSERCYGIPELRKLQSILILRELGMSLTAIKELLCGQRDPASALQAQICQLEEHINQLQKQLKSTQYTLQNILEGKSIMPVFDGFNNKIYRSEVIDTYGSEAWYATEKWWDSLDPNDREAFIAAHTKLVAAYDSAQDSGLQPEDPAVQLIVHKHFEWVQVSWGERELTRPAFAGLSQLYVTDERFAANYTVTHPAGAQFVADAVACYTN